jgi:hypothetical protein
MLLSFHSHAGNHRLEIEQSIEKRHQAAGALTRM